MILLLGYVPRYSDTARADRQRERLESMLQRINREGRDLLVPYRVTGNTDSDGDEFQAVYGKPERLFDHIWLVLYELHPVEAHFSIGIDGTDATGTEKPNGIVAGPALRHAITGMDRLIARGGWIGVSGLPEDVGGLVNYSLSLISDSMKKWNKRRFAILYAYSRNREIREVAEFLNISERSVYKNIQAGSMETILGTVNEIADIMGAG